MNVAFTSNDALGAGRAGWLLGGLVARFELVGELCPFGGDGLGDGGQDGVPVRRDGGGELPPAGRVGGVQGHPAQEVLAALGIADGRVVGELRGDLRPVGGRVGVVASAQRGGARRRRRVAGRRAGRRRAEGDGRWAGRRRGEELGGNVRRLGGRGGAEGKPWRWLPVAVAVGADAAAEAGGDVVDGAEGDVGFAGDLAEGGVG